ncbi:MAG: DUF1579 family protein [Bryobacteraceae bacterium]|nr:DUF1579 family protein [Bryobacteraceae bacterium]
MITNREITTTMPQPAAVIRLQMPRNQIQSLMGPAIEEVRQTLEQQGIEPAGPLFAHHLVLSGHEFDFEVGYPVNGNVRPAGRVTRSQAPGGRVARALYQGDYAGLYGAWAEFGEWLKQQNVQPGRTVWERYLRGPESDSNPASWQTELNFPLSESSQSKEDAMESTGTTAPTAVPQEQHQWLHRLVGEWTFEGEAVMGPDQPPMKSTGSETVRSLGGLWVMGEGTGNTPGGAMQSVITLGYDPARKRFSGTFIASCMTHLWIYDGELNGDVLTLSCEGPAMTPGAPNAPYKDVIELKSNDERLLTSFMQTPDGNWVQFMKATYRRK